MASPSLRRLVHASLAAGLLAATFVRPCAAQAQAPAPAPAPAPTRPQTRARQPVTLTVKTTDSTGAPLSGVKVVATGPVARSGVTTAAGEVRFSGIRNGVYRLRFDSDTTIAFEREVTIGAGQPTTIEVSLTAAPPPPPPPPAPKPEPAPAPKPTDVTPPEPRTISIPEFAERNMLSAREPSKSSLVACGATSATSLVQIRDPLKDQVHQDADALLYVVGGAGLLVMGTQEIPLEAGTFSVVPRGRVHTLQRRGRGGLILLSTLTDTPCATR